VEVVTEDVVAPVDQWLPLAEEEVSVTLFPAQIVVAPPVIVGAAGVAFTVTVTGAEFADTQPLIFE
jgi:hypothetical protein